MGKAVVPKNARAGRAAAGVARTPSAGVRAIGRRRRTSAHLPGMRADLERASIFFLGSALCAAARTMVALSRVQPVGREAVLQCKAAGRPILLVSWHGFDLCNLAVFPVLYGRHAPAVIMAPMTWEGRIMEQLATGFGYDVIPISADPNSPSSARGVVEMVSRIRRGADGMIAVDGPTGPREQAKLGAAVIAKRSRAVIVPTTVAGSWQFRVPTRWDKHLLILPSARMVVHFGPLIDPTPDEGPEPSPEEIRQGIETALHEGSARARAIAHGASPDV